MLLALFAIVALLLARHAFYDAWLPNTYLAKPSPLLHFMREHPPLQSFQALAGSLRSNPALHSPLREMGGLALAIGVAGAFMAARGARLFWSAVMASAVGLAFFAYAPPDWMPAGRFAVPFAFPLVFLAALGASAGLRRVPAAFVRGLSIALVLSVVVASGFKLAAIESLLGSMRQGELNSALDAGRCAEIGRWLAAHSEPGERVLAYEVGAVGYFFRLPIIDHEGLVTEPVARVIGRTGGYGDVRLGRDRQALAEVVQYCARQQPEWFMLRVLADEPPVLGSRVPEGCAREPIQNALLHEVGARMVVASTFPMGPASGRGREWYVLLHRVGATPS